MFVSYDLRDCRSFPSCRQADYIRLGVGLHAAVEPGQGLISARRGRALDLQFHGLSAQASWLELGLQLAGAGRSARDRAWRRSSRFYCRLRLALQPAAQSVDPQRGAQTDPEPEDRAAPPEEQKAVEQGGADSQAALQARLALRLHHPEGFEDIFAPDPLLLSPEYTWIRAEISPPVQVLATLRGVDLHLFLPPRDGALQVSDLGVTAVI